MKRIHNSEYLTIDSDAHKLILFATWKQETCNMNLDQFLIEGAIIIRTALKNKVSFIIGNNTDFDFTITPDLQEKMHKNILSKVNNSTIKKIAHITSSEMITQLSIEQLFDENENKTYQDKYFDNIDDAMKWCLK